MCKDYMQHMAPIASFGVCELGGGGEGVHAVVVTPPSAQRHSGRVCLAATLRPCHRAGYGTSDIQLLCSNLVIHFCSSPCRLTWSKMAR